MSRSLHQLRTCFLGIVIMTMTSCARGSIYDSLWKAEEYFTDPQLVALCKAIEKEDLAEMERLVKAGVDVNAMGKDGMTLLLWGYPMGEEVLEKLLELGADPNTQYNSGFGSRGRVRPGDSLLFVAIRSTGSSNAVNREKFQNYVDILLKHGADPNLIHTRKGIPPLKTTIVLNSPETAEKLIKAGADVNFKDDIGRPLIYYAARGRAFAIFRSLFEHGADYCIIDNNGLTVALVLGSYHHLMQDDSDLGLQFREAVALMEERGMSIERAKNHREQWENMDISGGKDQAVKKFISEVIEPEIALWLPPGVEPEAEVQEVAVPVAPPQPAGQVQAWNPLPVIAVVVVLLLLVGGIWFWMWRGKGGNVPP